MNALKAMFCVGLVLILACVAVGPDALSASSDYGNDNNDNNGNSNDDGGTSRAGEQLLSLLVLFTGPQNWDYVGVIGVYDAIEVSTEQSSVEDVF